LTAHTAIRLLLAVERTFDVEFPRRLLHKDTMASIESIARGVRLAKGEIYAPSSEMFREAASTYRGRRAAQLAPAIDEGELL
jgi:hypothetical protein